MRLVNKKFKSIDGFFNNSLNSIKVRDIQNIRNKNLCIVGRGNSISAIPFDKKSNIITQNNKNLIKLNKKKLEIFVDGNINVNLIINFLNKKKLFFPSFPSISNIKLGACIANCVHGHNPKIGTIRKFIKEIKLYNPNFGIKILTPKKNKKLFDLTIGGMGMTGLILSAKLKVFKLKSSFIKIEKEALFFNLYSLYKYLFSSKFIFNQNNFFINYSKKKLFTCRVISGNFLKKKFQFKKIKIKNVSNIRLNLFNVKIFKYFIGSLILLKRLFFKKKLIHINDAFYYSNKYLLYFNLLSKKFIQHQMIIPHRNVKKFFYDFTNLVKLYKPLITYGHFKIFNGKSKYLQFDSKGLAFCIDISINKNFYKFYNKFLILNKKNKCLLNLYKNSYLNTKIIKEHYSRRFLGFKKNILKINKNYKFNNYIFNEKTFY